MEIEPEPGVSKTESIPAPFSLRAHDDWRLRTKPAPEEAHRAITSLQSEEDVRIEEIEELDRGIRPSYKNNNFLATRVFQDGRRERVLYKSSTALKVSELTEALAVMAHIKERGVRVPTCYSFTNGAPVSGAEWRCFEYLGSERFRGGVEQLADVAREIARMHTALVGYTPGNAPRIIFMYGSLNSDTWAEHLSRIKDSSVERLLSAHKEYLFSKLDQASVDLTALLDADLLEEQVIHGDMHPQNTSFSEGRFTGLLDFDEMKIGSIGIDIGMACHRFVRNHLMTAGNTSPEAVREAVDTFVEAYCAENPTASPLIPYLPHFIREYLLRKMSSMLAGYANGTKDEQDALGEERKFLSFLREVDHIEECLGNLS